jgi:hypothetical protein
MQRFPRIITIDTAQLVRDVYTDAACLHVSRLWLEHAHSCLCKQCNDISMQDMRKMHTVYSK